MPTVRNTVYRGNGDFVVLKPSRLDFASSSSLPTSGYQTLFSPNVVLYCPAESNHHASSKAKEILFKFLIKNYFEIFISITKNSLQWLPILNTRLFKSD